MKITRSIPAIITALAALWQILPAATRADSILQFTGASRAKFVWEQDKWCNDNYVPTHPYTLDGPFQIVGYDTYDDKIRVFNAGVGGTNYGWMGGRVDRSGKWVVWPDLTNKCCWIRDFACATAARELIPKGSSFWASVCFGYEAATNKEYLYVEDSYDPNLDPNASCYCSKTNIVYKIPFDWATGTADYNNKINVGFKAGNGYDKLGISSVSGDGRYIACSFPWPTDYLFDTQSKTIINRHCTGQFGCQPHITPDNSYYFFHCMDDHEGIHVVGPNMTTIQCWDITFYKCPLPGRTSLTEFADFEAPQWSNHPRFLSDSYPSTAGYGDDGSWGNPGTDATSVKAMKMQYKRSVILQKFSADFKTIEGAIYICPDIRTIDTELDSWLSNGVVTPDAGTDIASPKSSYSATQRIRLASSGALVCAASTTGHMTLRISDLRGRSIRQASGHNAVTIETAGFPVGVYTVSAYDGKQNVVQALTIER